MDQRLIPTGRRTRSSITLWLTMCASASGSTACGSANYPTQTPRRSNGQPTKRTQRTGETKQRRDIDRRHRRFVRVHRIVCNLFGVQTGNKADGSPPSGRKGEGEEIDMAAINELIRNQADRMNSPADATDSGPRLAEARAKSLQAQALKDMAAAQSEGTKSLTAMVAASQQMNASLVGAMQRRRCACEYWQPIRRILRSMSSSEKVSMTAIAVHSLEAWRRALAW